MTLADYQASISTASTAKELHSLSRTAATDPQLAAADYITLRGAIGKRFARLNAEAMPKRQPRWDKKTIR